MQTQETQSELALDHCAAESYAAIVPGDVLWIVSMKGGRIWLRYRFVVTELATQAAADAKFGMQMWQAKFHLFGTGTRLLDIDITSLAGVLSFDSKSRPALSVAADGTVSNQAFRTARRLRSTCLAALESSVPRAA